MLETSDYPPAYLDELLDIKAAAQALNVSQDTLRRLGPDGPPRVQVSPRCCRYRRQDLLKWQLARIVTAPPPAPSRMAVNRAADLAATTARPRAVMPAPAAGRQAEKQSAGTRAAPRRRRHAEGTAATT
jgi:hypothetical protein